MPQPSISIFEIPLILDIICESIGPKEVWSCRRTCQLWAGVFEPYVWHRLRLSRRTTRPLAATRLLQQNASKVRSLVVHIADTVLLVPECTRLVHLTYFGGSHSNHRDNSLVQQQTLQDSSAPPLTAAVATDLIAQNPHLKSVAFLFEFAVPSPEFFTPPVLTGLRQSTISTLELDIRQHYPVTLLATILLNCRNTLSELIIYNAAAFEHTQVITELSGIGMPPPWKQFPSLVRLILRGSMRFQEESILFPLLRQCPSLRELELPSIRMSHSSEMVDILTGSCPLIDRMLRFSEHDDLTHEKCLQILEAFPGLVEFAFCYSEDMTPDVIEVLVERSGHSLEVLEVSAGFDTDNRERMGGCVERVLRDCARLRRLRVMHEWEVEATGIPLEDLVEGEWASREVEELWFPIGAPEFFCLSIVEGEEEDEGDGDVLLGRQGVRSDSGESVERGQQRVDTGLVVALARKLKRLSRLKNLNLLWMNPVVPLEVVLKYFEEEGGEGGEIDESFLRWMGLK